MELVINAVRARAKRYTPRKAILTFNVLAQAVLFSAGLSDAALGLSIANAIIWIWE